MLKLCYEARRICSKHISLTPLFLWPLASLVSEAKMGGGQLSRGIVDVEFKLKKKKKRFTTLTADTNTQPYWSC